MRAHAAAKQPARGASEAQGQGERPRDIISEQGLLDLLLVVTTLPTQAATHVAYADVAARRAAITNVFDAAHEAQLAAEAPPSDGGFTHKALSLVSRSLTDGGFTQKALLSQLHAL